MAPKTGLVHKFPCVLNLPPANLEGPASFFFFGNAWSFGFYIKCIGWDIAFLQIVSKCGFQAHFFSSERF